MRKMLGACPTCGGPLRIARLVCPSCDTAIEGNYEPCGFCRLSEQGLGFVETFIRCRGNIREVERELGVSYPTVRGRLDAVIRELGYEVEPGGEPEINARRGEILQQLDAGEISAAEATRLLRGLRK